MQCNQLRKTRATNYTEGRHSASSWFLKPPTSKGSCLPRRALSRANVQIQSNNQDPIIIDRAHIRTAPKKQTCKSDRRDPARLKNFLKIIVQVRPAFKTSVQVRPTEKASIFKNHIQNRPTPSRTNAFKSSPHPRKQTSKSDHPVRPGLPFPQANVQTRPTK